jgi:4-amino-4-deoxy-L-arabinose transferase-like glycosyltransferase
MRHRPATSLGRALIAGSGAGAILVAATVPFLGRYGWDRDELYFMSASHHLALGYVDFPPVTAWVAWLVRAIAGDSLDALRAVSLACAVATVILVALMARELGGGFAAQFGGAALWALTPLILGSASIYHPTWFDQLAWVAFLYVATRILVRPEPRLWALLGVVAGVGLEAKYTIVFLLAAFAVCLLVIARETLRTRGPGLAAGIALLLFVPNLVWQAQHGWPSVHFASSQNAKAAEDTSRAAFVVEQVLFLGAAFLVAVVGVVWLWRRRLQVLAVVPVLVAVLFFIERGRSYYPLPADALAVAAGAVALEGWTSRRRALALGTLAAAQIAVLVVVAPVVWPVLSSKTMVDRKIWKQSFYKDELGWPELTASVVRVWDGLPAAEQARAAVIAGNYGEASALEHFGRRELPLVLSGHLSWQYWRPRTLPQRYAITVGMGDHPGICRASRVVARIDNRWHIANEEQGRPIVACTLRWPLGRLWESSIERDSL